MAGELRVLMDVDWPLERAAYLRSLLNEGVALLTEPGHSDYDVLVSGRPDEGLITGSSRLKHLLIPWAGLPEQTRRLMRRHDHVSVHNIHHNADSAAEMAVGLMIAAARLIVPADRELRKGDWSWRYLQDRSVLINGSRVLVLGYGHLGRRIGRACSALGATVSGIRRNAAGERVSDGVSVFPPESLQSLLPDTDILVLALPLTEKTTGIVGRRELALLHERAILVNIGRGALVDEEALYMSLSHRSIGAAGIDVWYSYPGSVEDRTFTHPSRYDFASLDNVVMTPHMGGAFGSGRLEMARAEMIAFAVNSLASTGIMPGKVDLAAGY